MTTSRRRAIYGRLAGDTTLTGMLGTPPAGYSQSIYYQSAPDKVNYPIVVFNKQSGVPTQAMHDPTAFDNDVWLVKAVDHSSSADKAEAIVERIKTLLNDASLSIAGGEILLFLRRMSDVDYEEITSGETYKHAGSLFRLTVTH